MTSYTQEEVLVIKGRHRSIQAIGRGCYVTKTSSFYEPPEIAEMLAQQTCEWWYLAWIIRPLLEDISVTVYDRRNFV